MPLSFIDKRREKLTKTLEAQFEESARLEKAIREKFAGVRVWTVNGKSSPSVNCAI